MLFVVLQDHDQRITLKERIELVVANLTGARMLAVIDDCFRGKHDPIPVDPQPPAEVDILEVHKEVFVVATNLEEYLAIDKERATTGKELLLRGNLHCVDR